MIGTFNSAIRSVLGQIFPAGFSEAESTGGASVFLVRGGRVATPHLGSAILESLTRRSAIEVLSDEFGIAVEERGVERTGAMRRPCSRRRWPGSPCRPR